MRNRNPLCGIYSILCILNNKVYVGSSTDIRHRWCQHRHSLNKMLFSNIHLQNDYILYGKDNFIFSVLELCNNDSLLIYESKWMTLLNSRNSLYGYNIMDSLNGNVIIENVNASKVKLSFVYCIDKITGDIVKGYRKDLELYFNSNYKRLSECLQYWHKYNKNCHKSYNGYIFVCEYDYDVSFDYVNYKRPVKVKDSREKIKKDIIPYSDRNLFRVSVIACDKITNVEYAYNSIAECSLLLGLMKRKVYEALKFPYMQRSHHGYYFKKAL